MKIAVYRDSAAGRLPIARIEAAEDGSNASLSYDPEYLRSHQSINDLGISERLPLREEAYASEEISPFLQGLLPEGETLGNLTQMYQVARSNWPMLLQRLGCESVGALTFVPEGEDENDYEPGYRPLTEQDIFAMRRDPARAATEVASSTRLSLSGAQSKVAWTLPESIDAGSAQLGDWMAPYGSAASTHIIKMSRKGEEDLAVNELSCSLLAKACGIDVAEVSLVPGVPGAIAVTRYDRRWLRASGTGNGAVMRLHQEDFCQALGLQPFYKYQPSGIAADYIEYAADLIDDASDTPVEDRLEFAKRLVFNYAAGNADAHLKNSSLLYNETWTGRRLAPMYDVTCIPLSGYSTRMPFDIGSHRELAEIDERDIMAIALSCDVSLSAFDQVVREVVAGFEAPSLVVGNEAVAAMAEQVLANAAPRIAVLRAFLS